MPFFFFFYRLPICLFVLSGIAFISSLLRAESPSACQLCEALAGLSNYSLWSTMHQGFKVYSHLCFLKTSMKKACSTVIRTSEYFSLIQLDPDPIVLRWKHKLASTVGEGQFCTKGAVSLPLTEADLDFGVNRDVPWDHNMLSTHCFMLCSFHFLNNQWEPRILRLWCAKLYSLLI